MKWLKILYPPSWRVGHFIDIILLCWTSSKSYCNGVVGYSCTQYVFYRVCDRLREVSYILTMSSNQGMLLSLWIQRRYEWITCITKMLSHHLYPHWLCIVNKFQGWSLSQYNMTDQWSKLRLSAFFRFNTAGDTPVMQTRMHKSRGILMISYLLCHEYIWITPLFRCQATTRRGARVQHKNYPAIHQI